MEWVGTLGKKWLRWCKVAGGTGDAWKLAFEEGRLELLFCALQTLPLLPRAHQAALAGTH